MDIWIATGNEKKRRELCRLLEPLGYSLRMQSELSDFVAAPEDKPDFAGNAAVKAATLARRVQALAIGDDSGLCVDALGGRPGVLSARYAGPGATDRDLVDKLLGELDGLPREQRSAQFVCCICLAGADGSIRATFQGQCRGAIDSQPRGSAGFGYDPVFVPETEFASNHPRTFAELTAEDKDLISHRGNALRQLADHLQSHSL